MMIHHSKTHANLHLGCPGWTRTTNPPMTKLKFRADYNKMTAQDLSLIIRSQVPYPLGYRTGGSNFFEFLPDIHHVRKYSAQATPFFNLLQCDSHL